MSNTRNEKKVAVVTGASKGIGLATVRALHASGFQVMGTARTITDELNRAATATLAADLGTSDGPSAVIDAARERFGGIDVLVNNVGAFTARTEGFAAITDDQWQQTFEINLFAAVRAIRAALADLVDRKGTIINVSSINARSPQPPVVDYAAAKAAITNIGVSLAQELGSQGVQVATVSPGPTRTPAWTSPDGFGAQLAAASGMSHEDFLEEFPSNAGIQTARLTAPAEVAAVIELIASGRAPNAHGTDWAIDGGQATHT